MGGGASSSKANGEPNDVKAQNKIVELERQLIEAKKECASLNAKLQAVHMQVATKPAELRPQQEVDKEEKKGKKEEKPDEKKEDICKQKQAPEATATSTLSTYGHCYVNPTYSH